MPKTKCKTQECAKLVIHYHENQEYCFDCEKEILTKANNIRSMRHKAYYKLLGMAKKRER